MEVKITMEKFMELVKRTAKLKLGRSATIEESTIAKNNELIYQGTEAMIHGNRIHRSAYLEQFYGFFDHDADLRECIGKMVRVDVKPETITESNSIFRDMSDWEKMRPRVCCQIINRARNLKLLRKVSNTEYLDLAVVYSLEFKEYGPYIYSVRVTKKMLEQMNVSMEELHEQALINMKRKFPYKIELLEDIILNQTASVERQEFKVIHHADRPLHDFHRNLHGSLQAFFHPFVFYPLLYLCIRLHAVDLRQRPECLLIRFFQPDKIHSRLFQSHKDPLDILLIYCKFFLTRSQVPNHLAESRSDRAVNRRRASSSRSRCLGRQNFQIFVPLFHEHISFQIYSLHID